MCEVNYSEPSQTVLHEGPDAKLDAKHVKTRKANGTYLHYVEGWHVIAEANRIFGYDVGSPKAFRPEIDKSVLTFGEPNRIPLQGATAICRQQPCLSRGRSPSHAHHVRYAQSKGLAQFRIGLATAIRWVHRVRQTGDRTAGRQGQPRRSKLDPHRDYILGLVKTTPDGSKSPRRIGI